MYKQHSYAKIADYRGARRVWLEGLRLAACGFDKGAKYNTVYNVGSGTIKLILDDDGSRAVSGRKKGDGYTPIVDICNADLVKVTGDAQRVRVDFEAGAITITVHHHDAKQAARETAFLNNINGGGITEGSLCAGIGVATAAIHAGLTENGVKSSVSWVVDRERKYLQVAADNNKALSADTVLFEASLEELEPELLAPVDLVQVSLPCTGHSLAGKSKNKIATAEEHATDATALIGLINIINGINPAVIVSENVKEARNSASYLLLKGYLVQLGYNIHEIELDETQAGSLEKRARYWFIAVSAGIDSLDVEKIIKYERSAATVGDILEPVADDAASWSDNQYLKDKAISDKAAGKGFANRCLITGDSVNVNTIGRHYNKRRSTEPMLTRPDGKERLLTPVEHARVKGVPASLVAGLPATTAHEGLGQGITWNQGRGIGALITQLTSNTKEGYLL